MRSDYLIIPLYNMIVTHTQLSLISQSESSMASVLPVTMVRVDGLLYVGDDLQIDTTAVERVQTNPIIDYEANVIPQSSKEREIYVTDDDEDEDEDAEENR